MMSLIECAKALQKVFSEELEPQELIDALEKQEIMEMEQIMMQEEILAAEAEEEAEYKYVVDEAWKQHFMQNEIWEGLCEEVDNEYGISLKKILNSNMEV